MMSKKVYKFIDIGSGYSPYKKFDTCDVNAYCTYYNIKNIPSNYYDMIRIRNVLHHVKNIDLFINDCLRILNKKGRIVIIDCLECDYKSNYFLDILWYRFIKKDYNIYISKKFRKSIYFNDYKIRGGKLWKTLRKN